MADTLPLRQDRYLVIGDGADFAAVSTSGDWPGTTRLIIESAALVETSFTPTIATTTATWALTVAQVTALVGTKTSGVLRYRVTVSSGDQLRGEIAGFLSIKTKWDAARTVQTLGAVVVGPAGPIGNLMLTQIEAGLYTMTAGTLTQIETGLYSMTGA